jgi:hypothetical protein
MSARICFAAALWCLLKSDMMSFRTLSNSRDRGNRSVLLDAFHVSHPNISWTPLGFALVTAAVLLPI